MDGLRRALPILLLAAFIVTSCSPQERISQEGGSLTLACSDSFVPLARALMDEFSTRQPRIAIHLDTGNGLAVQGRLASGTADVAILAEPLDSLSGAWRQRPIALEALAIIVHPEQRLSETGFAQIQAVFSGRLAAWQTLGEEGGDIQPVSREGGASARHAFENAVMGGKRVTPLAVLMPTSALMAEYVAAHPDAIGYVAAHWADAAVKALAVEGSLPTQKNVRDGTYPLVMVGHLVWQAKPTAEAKAFADFVASPAGLAAVLNAGYAPP